MGCVLDDGADEASELDMLSVREKINCNGLNRLEWFSFKVVRFATAKPKTRIRLNTKSTPNQRTWLRR